MNKKQTSSIIKLTFQMMALWQYGEFAKILYPKIFKRKIIAYCKKCLKVR
jgi:hypothetical protein